jgi:hypothetical protein
MPHNRAFIGLVVFAGIAGAAAAQAPRIVVGPPSRISEAQATGVFVESYLAVNPRDSKNIIATAIVNGRDGPTSGSTVRRSDVFASFDGGKTWALATAEARDTLVFQGGDPVVFFDSAGTAYFAILGDGFRLSRSTDGGRTWKMWAQVSPRGFDREYLAIDNTGGKYNGRMYAIGNGSGVPQRGLDGAPIKTTNRAIALTTSADSGRTWALSTMISSGADEEATHTPSELFVMNDGTVVAPFVNYGIVTRKDGGFSGGPGRIGVAISRDGGRTFDAVRLGPVRHWSPGTQGQTTQSSPLRAAIDRTSGPNKGRIYLTFNDYDSTRKQYVIRVTASSDTGKTWSTPVTVNDDTTKATMVMPAIAVNRNGLVGVVWHDRRDDPSDLCYRLYFAVSADGGATFLPNVRGSDRPSCGASAQNQIRLAPRTAALDRSTGRARRAVNLSANAGFEMIGGHTLGLDADAAGTFYAAWSNAESGISELWLQRFTVEPAPSPIAASDAGRPEVTDKVDLTLSSPAIDTAARTITVTVRIKNSSKDTLTGPFTIVLDDLQSKMLKGVRSTNADNKSPGRGATWNIPLDGSQLLPGKESGTKILTWSYNEVLPWPGTGRREWGSRTPPPEPLKVYFLVLGGKK